GTRLGSRQAGAEDACEPSASSLSCPSVGECLPGSGCATGDCAMRTCCTVESEAPGTAAGLATEKKVPSLTGPAPGTLPGARGELIEVVAGRDSSPVAPLPEPCLKAPSKDTGSVPAPAKHVAFVEPAVDAGEAELPSQGSTGTSPGAVPQPGGGKAPKQPQGGTAD
ncbi:hypothetical protein N332_10810, partial [Mesitornis unicolor]